MIDLVRMGWELRAPVLIGYICVAVVMVFAAPDRPDNRSRLAARVRLSIFGGLGRAPGPHFFS